MSEYCFKTSSIFELICIIFVLQFNRYDSNSLVCLPLSNHATTLKFQLWFSQNCKSQHSPELFRKT